MHRPPSSLNNVLIYVNSYKFRASLTHCLDMQVCELVNFHCNNPIIKHGKEIVKYFGKCHKYELYLLQYGIVRIY